MDKAGCIQAATGLIIVLIVGMSIATSATLNPGMDKFVEESNDWCADRGGGLYNARVIGEHGGLHCELPNGTDVHMHEVIDHGA